MRRGAACLVRVNVKECKKMKNNIRVARAEVRMTQQQLADAAGVSRQTVNAIESGKFVPSTLLALKMAGIFGKRVEELFVLGEEDW